MKWAELSHMRTSGPTARTAGWMSGSSRSSHNIWRYLEEHLDVLLAERKIAYFIDDKQLWGHDTAIECNFVGTQALSSRQL